MNDRKTKKGDVKLTFNDLYLSVKKKLNSHPEITLERQKLAVQISDVFDNAFYILWENNKCSSEPFHYHDHNVSIIASQRDIELLFTERQYLFLARREINIRGSFTDVMAFQELLSYITRDNSYVVQEEIISKMLLKQDMLREDLGIIMQSLQLLLTNSLLSIPENYIDSSQQSEESTTAQEKKSKKSSASTTRKKKAAQSENHTDSSQKSEKSTIAQKKKSKTNNI